MLPCKSEKQINRSQKLVLAPDEDQHFYHIETQAAKGLLEGRSTSGQEPVSQTLFDPASRIIHLLSQLITLIGRSAQK